MFIYIYILYVVYIYYVLFVYLYVFIYSLYVYLYIFIYYIVYLTALSQGAGAIAHMAQWSLHNMLERKYKEVVVA